MKKAITTLSMFVALGTFAASASAQEVLIGDTRLACEAVLCLASGSRPSECNPSLKRYFSISASKFKDTIKKRRNFLKLCPSSNQTPEMASLVDAMSRGAGRCDAAGLNTWLMAWRESWRGEAASQTYISNQMPDYCSIYANHDYTDFTGALPRYVGTPDAGGYWVEAKDFDRATAEHNARLQVERQRTYNRPG